MKNAIKKIAAIAMAFTLIGTGTAVTKTIAPKTDNTIVANAACKHKVGGSSWSNWYFDGSEYQKLTTRKDYYERTCYCSKCGKPLQTQSKYKEYSYSFASNAWIYVRTVYC